MDILKHFHEAQKIQKSNSWLNGNACSIETFCLCLTAYEQNSNCKLK